MSAPRPLYRLPELASATRIYIAEGEKAADAMRGLGLIATTSPHGSNSASKALWSPLAGKECIVTPDRDEPGRRYARRGSALAGRAQAPAHDQVLNLPDLPIHGDAVGTSRPGVARGWTTRRSVWKSRRWQIWPGGGAAHGCRCR